MAACIVIRGCDLKTDDVFGFTQRSLGELQLLVIDGARIKGVGRISESIRIALHRSNAKKNGATQHGAIFFGKME